MTATQETKDAKARLEAQLSATVGFPIEITIRGEKSFTYSADGDRRKEFTKLSQPYPGQRRIDYDAEIDFTCLFLDF